MTIVCAGRAQLADCTLTPCHREARASKTFAVVHHGRPRGVRVRLDETDYQELIIGCEDPEPLVAKLTERA